MRNWAKGFFEKRTAKIAITESTFLSIIIGIYSEPNFLIFFDVAKALYINSEYVNDLLLSKIIFLLGFFLKFLIILDIRRLLFFNIFK